MNFRKYFGVKNATFSLSLVLGRCLFTGWGFGDCLKPNMDMFLPKALSMGSSFVSILSY
jgi:hypothetical protein